jgi:hypothetical protein
MPDKLPNVNTASWRLPKRGNTPEQTTMTSEMFERVGLSVPGQGPVVEGHEHQATGLPSIDTSDWRLSRAEEPGSLLEAVLPSGKKRKRSAEDDRLPPVVHNQLSRPALQRADVERPLDGLTVERMRQLAGLEETPHLEFALGSPHRRMPAELEPVELPRLQESRTLPPRAEGSASSLPVDQSRLAGITESSRVGFPTNDAGHLRRPTGHGMLDPHDEAASRTGEDFVGQVLAESRWFFRDFAGLSLGAFDALGEAPGGRSEPWTGDDEPAKTPIVRKGKTHGAVGDDIPPEGKHGAVDVGKSEIDYDDDEDDDEDHEEPKTEKKGKCKSKGKNEPQEESLGGAIKRVGHALSHGYAAQRARRGAKRVLKKRLKKFVKKHGIDVGKFHDKDD